MLEVLTAMGCPRCAAGVAARDMFWADAPLERLTVALLPFLAIAVASWAAARIERDAGADEGRP